MFFFECLRDVYKKNKLCHQSVPHVFFNHSYQQTKKHTNKTRQLRQLRSTPDCFAASECLFFGGGGHNPPKVHPMAASESEFFVHLSALSDEYERMRQENQSLKQELSRETSTPKTSLSWAKPETSTEKEANSPEDM